MTELRAKEIVAQNIEVSGRVLRHCRRTAKVRVQTAERTTSMMEKMKRAAEADSLSFWNSTRFSLNLQSTASRRCLIEL